MEQFKAGAKLVDAIAAENKKLKNQQAEMARKAAAGEDTAPANSPEPKKTDPAEQEFSDKQKAPEKPDDDGSNATEKFMAITRKYADTHKCKMSEAVSKCTVTHRKEHQAMLDENTVTEERRR